MSDIENLRKVADAWCERATALQKELDAVKADAERYKSELNEYDKALRCEGWPFEARIERAKMLAAGVDKLKEKG